jgi:hypothetical protein
MNLESLKEKIGDETFTELKSYVDALVSQRDEARQESISGRKGLKEKLAKLEADQGSLMEKLGIDSLEDIENLPNPKGMAEAAQQYEVKLKRLQRERDEALSVREQTEKRWRESMQKAAMSEALSGHEFIARDVVETFVKNQLTWEGDDLLFKTSDGKLVPITDGVAAIAKTRPELIKPTGTGGAGVRSTNTGSVASKQMTRAEFEAMNPQQKVEAAKAGVSLI